MRLPSFFDVMCRDDDRNIAILSDCQKVSPDSESRSSNGNKLNSTGDSLNSHLSALQPTEILTTNTSF